MAQHPPRKPAQTSGTVVPHAASWHQKLASGLITLLARALMVTWRMQWEDRSGQFNPAKSTEPLLFCVWHNRLALSMEIYHGFVRQRYPAEGLAALISASKDGGLLADVLAKFGVQAVRGSSSRRGAQALLEATGWVEKGYHVAITPDGPRGPRYKVQEGIIALAQVTGARIIPLSATVNWKVRTNSWDQFQVPLPFAKCKVVFAEAISVPRDASDSERERIRQQLEQAMTAITPE